MSSNKLLHIEIVTPKKIIFSGNVKNITVPGELGSFQILYNHAPIISNLVTGEIKIRKENDEIEYYVCEGGFVFVLRNRITIMSDSIVHANDIDINQVENELNDLKSKLTESQKYGDVDLIEKLIMFKKLKLKVAKRIST